MAWPRVASLAIILLALLVATACSTTEGGFNHTRVQTLEFGAMSSGDYHSVFGKPSKSEITTNADGKFEKVTFVHWYKGMGRPELRMLMLEFRDETLNAWNYLSTFEEDRTGTDTFLAAKIQTGLHRKHNVEAILGKPTGKALCPSLLAGAACTGTEVWTWGRLYILDKTTTLWSTTPAGADVYVLFANSGIVTQVITVPFRPPPH